VTSADAAGTEAGGWMSLSVAWIAGAAAAGVVILLAVIICVVVIICRRIKSSRR